MLERLFSLDAKGTTAGREITAGATTFLTMAYIMFVNPMVLAGAGLDHNAVFVATCLSAAITTAAMGLYANLPVALAPGMGLNVYFAYTVVPALNGDWQLALGCVALAGIGFVAISLSPVRAWIIDAIPHSMKIAIAAGIGFFLALIGFENAGVVAPSVSTIIREGTLSSPKTLIAGATFVAILAMSVYRVRGAVFIGIICATAAAILMNLEPQPAIASLPPSLAPTFLRLHFSGAAGGAIASIVFVFLLVELLDTSGTLTAVAQQSGLVDDKGRLLNARRALVCDAAGTIVGAALGTSPVTAYIESAAGIESGGRTGLTALTVSVLFLAGLFLSPLASAVPGYATAPALVFVAVLMAKGLKDIAWDDITEAAPALVTALAIPFTFSIAAGVGIGFITYAALKIATGRMRELNPAVAAIALAFAAKVALT